MYVPEEEGDLGVYSLPDGLHNSNTAISKYSWGLDPSDLRRAVTAAAREIVRETKKRDKIPSQDEAIQIGFSGIQKEKEKYTVFGTEMHKAFQNFDESKPVILPTPKHQAFFQGFLFFRKQHEIKPILIEKLLVCPHCGIATQVDFYGEVDGLRTIIDYKTGYSVPAKTGLQLTCNRHVLEHNGYIVEQSWAVHVQEYLAYPIEFSVPWSEYEIVLKNFELKKKYMQPKIYIREFADKKAAAGEEIDFKKLRDLALDIRAMTEAEKKEALGKAKTSIEQESALDSNIQGRQSQQEEPEILPRDGESAIQWMPISESAYRGLEETASHEIAEELSRPALPTQKRRRGRPRKSPSANTSSRKAATRQRIQPEEVELNPKHVHPKRLKRRLFQRAA